MFPVGAIGRKEPDMNKSDKSSKHLTLDDRISIQNLLDANVNLTAIGSAIGKHRTTISKEIKLHRYQKDGISSSVSKVPCSRFELCPRRKDIPCPCPDYEPPVCPRTARAPFVCNGCPDKGRCRLNRFFYSASLAHRDYLYMLSDSRSGILLPKETACSIEEVITPLIVAKKQSINQVYINHPDVLPFSKPTFYKYINEGILGVRNLDLPRKVRYRQRKSSSPRTPVNTLVRQDRTYEDYQKFVAAHPFASIVQMDTVIGTGGGKGGTCFLTLLFVRSCLMLILPLPYKRMEYVTEAFVLLRKLLGNEEYHRLFEVILTDNGSEFFDPAGIEADFVTGEQRSHVFYCDPNASWQKGALEKNHEYIRYVLPKGRSFAGMTYEKCALLASHINSVPRLSLNSQTPFDIARMLIGTDNLKKLSIQRIEADDVCLSPKLLRPQK